MLLSSWSLGSHAVAQHATATHAPHASCLFGVRSAPAPLHPPTFMALLVTSVRSALRVHQRMMLHIGCTSPLQV